MPHGGHKQAVLIGFEILRYIRRSISIEYNAWTSKFIGFLVTTHPSAN